MNDSVFSKIKTSLSALPIFLKWTTLKENSSDVLRSNPKVVAASIKKNWYTINYALEDGLTEENINLAIEKGYFLSDESPAILRSNPKVVTASIKKSQYTIEHALEDGLTDENIELAIQGGYFLMSTSDSPIFLKNNPKIVNRSIKVSSNNIELALEGGLTEENINLAIEKGYSLREWSPDILRSNPEVIKAFIKKDPENLNYALDGSLTEENINLAIEKGYFLSDYSSAILRSNPEVIKAFIKKDPENLNYALDGSLTEENINLAIEKGYFLSDYSSAILRSNPEVIKAFIKKDPKNLNYALEDGLTEENINLAIEEGYSLSDKSPDILRRNPKVVAASIKKNCFTINYALEDGLTEENINLAIENGYSLNVDSSTILRKNSKIVKLYMDKYLGGDIVSDEEIELAIQNGYVLTNDCFNILSLELLSSAKLKILSEYFKIPDSNLRVSFTDYIVQFHKDIDMEKIRYISEVLLRLSLSNSSEIFTFRQAIATQILKSNNPLESLSKIEDVFIRNNIPAVGKIYFCFEILYPDFEGFDFESSMVSPVLKRSSTTSKKVIVFSDLIKSSFGSNNKSVNAYLDNIEFGSHLYESIKSGQVQFDSLGETEMRELTIFRNHLATLYNNTMKATKENERFTSAGDVLTDILELSKKLSPDGTLDYNLADRVIRMFCGFTGIDTLEQAKEYIKKKVKTADLRNRNASNLDMVLEQGDFIKGIGNITHLRNILQNGSVAKEYLGSDASSDLTPLDTDISMIMRSDGTISEKMNATAASDYGPIWFVLKNDDRFMTTRTSSETLEAKRDMSKMEVFYTGVIDQGHYGIRTGFASSEINYIVMENYDSRVGLEIAMNGFYIPVANKEGKIVFTPKDYDELRSKMSGLSYFDEENYTFSENLITEETEYFAGQIEQSNYEVQSKREKINSIIKKSLEELGLHLKTNIDGNLTEGFVELIDTGSTGRGTNKPGDGDFDFMMRLDKTILSNPSRLNELKQTILRNLGRKNSSELTGTGDFRLKSVQIDTETSVDIDITFTEKTDKVFYSTDMALQDRLATIQRADPEKYKYVVANILLAKQVLKQAEAYKPNRGEVPQGGLGGVGIENWILQNGGSFIDAARSFVEASEGKNFSEFQSSYQIWDFGDNHLAERRGQYPHDNFVSNNMSESGYQKMVGALKEYLQQLDFTKVEDRADAIVQAMENGILDVDGNPIYGSDFVHYQGKSMGYSGIQLLGIVASISSIIIAVLGILMFLVYG